MNIESLKTFLLLVETGNFTKTAHTMMLAQSTVSGRIQELEQELGYHLINHNRKYFSLTQAGISFLEYAQKIVNLERDALMDLNLTNRYSNILRIGSTYNLYDIFMGKKVEKYVAKYPKIAINLEINTSEYFISNLESANYDLVLFYYPLHHPKYICEHLIEEDIILATSAKNQLFASGITTKQLSEIPLIYNYFMDAILPDYRLYSLKINIASKTINFLKTGCFYGFIPRNEVEKELKKGSLIEIPILDISLPKKESFIIYKKNYREIEPLYHFLQLIKKIGINPF